MDIVIDFLSTTTERPELAIPVIIAMAVIAVLWILFSNERDALLNRITHKRNQISSIIIVLVFLALLLIAVDTVHFHITVFSWIIVCIWIITILVAYHDMKPMLFVTGSNRTVYHHRRLRHYADELWRGKINSCERVMGLSKQKLNLRERLDRFLFRHPKLLDRDAQIQIQFLHCRLFLLKNDVESAYETLATLNESEFYPEEWNEVLVKKAQCLAWMGNISTAKTAMKMAGVDDESSALSTSPEVLITQAYIAELSGEFDKAYEYAVRARDHVELSNLSTDRKAVILNDCARYDIIHDSRVEADKAISAAWRHIKENRSELGEAIGVNLIYVLIEHGYSESDVMKAFEELKAIHNDDSIDADIRFHNIHIQILRQFGHQTECYNLIKEFYKNIKPKLKNKGQLECIKASVFHQMMDGEYDYTWIDEEIVAESGYYDDLSFYDKTAVFKHYYEILSQARYKYVRLRKPYAELYDMITRYYEGGSAIKEIEEQLGAVKDYNVFRTSNLMQRRIFVLTVQDKTEHIKKNIRYYDDWKSYLLNQGLRLEAINAEIQLVVDASSPSNIPMTDQISGQKIRFADYAENSPVLFPVKDGIYIRYEDVLMMNPWIVPGEPEDIELIREHTEKAIEDIRGLQNHPFKAEVSLKLIKMCLGLRMDEEAKELYSYATENGRSENTLAPWARLLLSDVRAQFSETLDGLN